MRLLILLPAMLLPAASVAGPSVIQVAPQPQAITDMRVFNPNDGAADSCPPTSRYQAMQKNSRTDPQKLNQLPAADHYKAAYRTIGDCEVPIIAGYNIGGR